MKASFAVKGARRSSLETKLDFDVDAQSDEHVELEIHKDVDGAFQAVIEGVSIWRPQSMEERLPIPNLYEDINDEDCDQLQQDAEFVIEPSVDFDNLFGELLIATVGVGFNLPSDFLG